MTATARRTVFTFDGEGWPWFEGITFGDTWNGFANPWFDAYVLAALAGEWAAYNATVWADDPGGAGPGEWVTFTFGSRGVVTINRAWTSNAAPFAVETLPTVDVDGVTYYGLTNCWTWLEPDRMVGEWSIDGRKVIRSPRTTGERPPRPAEPEGITGGMLADAYAPADAEPTRPCPRCGGWGLVPVEEP